MSDPTNTFTITYKDNTYRQMTINADDQAWIQNFMTWLTQKTKTNLADWTIAPVVN